MLAQVFQSTFPRGERHIAMHDNVVNKAFQSTFPRGERHGIRKGNRIKYTISIHVPAWGTTSPEKVDRRAEGNFNPRSRVGNDISRTVSALNKVISIHVPAWGTTMFRKTETVLQCDFNPRSRVGNDEYKKTQMRIDRNFNPRSRVGNDVTSPTSTFPVFLFQSTFPRGERRHL